MAGCDARTAGSRPPGRRSCCRARSRQSEYPYWCSTARQSRKFRGDTAAAGIVRERRVFPKSAISVPLHARVETVSERNLNDGRPQSKPASAARSIFSNRSETFAKILGASLHHDQIGRLLVSCAMLTSPLAPVALDGVTRSGARVAAGDRAAVQGKQEAATARNRSAATVRAFS